MDRGVGIGKYLGRDGMYTRKDFQVPNIANAPVSEERIRKIFYIFGRNSLNYKTMVELESWKVLSVSQYTFAKVISHASKVGILEKEDGAYHLSGVSQEYFDGRICYKEYMREIVGGDEKLYRMWSIIVLLLSFFGGKMKKRTISYIFSAIGTGRSDKSALHSVGRNLAPVYNMLCHSGYTVCGESNIILQQQDKIQDLFAGKQVLTVNDIRRVFSQYFEREVIEEMLSVVSTFEYERYVWSKSSLYKNQGEIRNLDGDYIMAVMKQFE